MGGHGRVLVGVGLFDLPGNRQVARHLRPRGEDLAGQRGNAGLRQRFRCDDQVIDADRLHLVFGPGRR